MEESNFFKNIWRFNAIVIAVAGVLAVVVLTFVMYMIYKEKTRDRHRHDIVNVDPKTKIEESFRFGRVAHVKGSRSIIVPLYSDQKFSFKYSRSKSTASTRNLLFLDTRISGSKWLLPNNSSLIASYRLLNESNDYSDDKDVIGIFYQVVKSDTNKDSRLTKNDKITIAISTPSGGKYTEIASDVDEVLGCDLIEKKEVIVLYNRNGSGHIVQVKLSDFSVTMGMKLPKLN